MPELKKTSLLAQNKKAFVDYEILEKVEAGIILSGAEVKSVRAGHTNLKGSYIDISDRGEAWTHSIHISAYKNAPQSVYDPLQSRKLLLHKEEIARLRSELETKGTTVVPLDFHLSHNRIKLTLAICRGKKKYDRRQELKKKAQNLEIRRALRKY